MPVEAGLDWLEVAWLGLLRALWSRRDNPRDRGVSGRRDHCRDLMLPSGTLGCDGNPTATSTRNRSGTRTRTPISTRTASRGIAPSTSQLHSVPPPPPPPAYSPPVVQQGAV